MKVSNLRRKIKFAVEIWKLELKSDCVMARHIIDVTAFETRTVAAQVPDRLQTD